jgi:hypothetical protein
VEIYFTGFTGHDRNKENNYIAASNAVLKIKEKTDDLHELAAP